MRFASRIIFVAAVLLLVLPSWAQQNVAIRDVQFVHPDSLKLPGNRDDSPFINDTVRVVGVAVSGPRSLWIGARWSFILADTAATGEWDFIQIVQHDTLTQTTNVPAVQVGDLIEVTGIVNEFPINNRHSHTQIESTTGFPLQVNFLGAGRPLPQPVELTAGAFASQDSAERYECALITINNARMLNNNSGNGNGQALMEDATGQLLIDDWFLKVHNAIDVGAGGSVENIPQYYPPNGARFNITGYIRDLSGPQAFAIGIEDASSIVNLTNPPTMSGITRNVGAPTSAQTVTVSATITDNGTVTEARIFYSIDNGTTYQEVAMTPGASNVYSGDIPPQANGTFVRYYIRAMDNDGDASTNPGNISESNFFYTVRDSGPTIYDIQFTPFANGNSGYVGLSVTVSGIVSADSSDFSNEFYLQDGRNPWGGIWVRDSILKPKRGDNVTITGKVEERFGNTRMTPLTAMTVNSRGNDLPDPVDVHTGDIRTGAATAESYESMLLRVKNAVVSNALPDAPSNFGEFSIDDGSGEVRVDDRSNEYRGQLDNTYAVGDSILSMVAILDFTFSNFKLQPRTNAEVVLKTTEVNDRGDAPLSYHLEQNYPNPFNPETAIHYQLARAGHVELSIHNLLGQKVRTLVNGLQSVGSHQLTWDGKNDFGATVPSGIYFYKLHSGSFVQVKKMALIR